MSNGAKGFQKLEGVTITKVDASCVNQVILCDSEGNTFTIDVEQQGAGGIPLLRLTKAKPRKTAVLQEKAAPVKDKSTRTYEYD